MPRNNQRGRNNNPEGRNQYSNGWMDTARDRPFAAATVAAATVGAGVFLWSRRNQISEQISNLSDQIGEWTENMNSGSSDQFEMAGGESSFNASSGTGATGSTGGSGSTSGIRSSSSSGSTSGKRSGGKGSSSGLSETGGGNASLGAHSGGGGMSAANSGRGRA